MGNLFLFCVLALVSDVISHIDFGLSLVSPLFPCGVMFCLKLV